MTVALQADDGQDSGGGSIELPAAYKSKLILEEQLTHIVTIAIYESYYMDDQGNKKVVIFSPDHPEIELAGFDHKWSTGPKAGQEKRWKHDQFRYEDRNPYYIDSRGIGHLLKDNQQAASQYLNIKGYHYDLASYPMYRNTGGAVNVNNFRPGPGKVMPEGLDFAQLPGVDPVFNFDADIERAKSAQRVGSTLGSESSVNKTRDRKTAEEVRTERSNSQLMSAGSLMRFTRPLSSIYSNMWEEIQANPIALPVISASTGEITGELPPEVFSLPFIVISSANSRSSDPDNINAQLSPLLQILQNFPQIDPSPILEKFLSNIDPDMSDKALQKQQQPDMLKNLEELNQAVGQLSQENTAMAERIEALLEMAEVNITTDKRQDKAIKNIAEAKREVAQLIKDEVKKLKPETKSVPKSTKTTK